jgi:imidazolonepropionase-like amidohydrolase
MSDAMGNAVEIATSAGVLVGSGSDLLGPEQRDRGMEIGLKARYVGAQAAITSATLANAKIMGLEADVGTVEAGKVADLIAVDGHPLIEPSVLGDVDRVVLVMKAGEIVKDLRASASNESGRSALG